MKKHFFTFLLTVLISATTLQAQKVQIGGLFYNLNKDKHTAEVISQTSESQDNYAELTKALIPETVEDKDITYTVTAIGDHAFSGCAKLTSVVIPGSVTSIGTEAFYECSQLACVTFGNGINTIGVGAFKGCGSVTAVELPESVTEIGEYAFVMCSNLLYITCKAVNPPALMPYGFSGVETHIPLYVPAQSVDAYINAEQWKGFEHIFPLNGIDENYTGIGSFSISPAEKVSFSPGNLQYNATMDSHLCADGQTLPGTWRFAEHQWTIVGIGYGQINPNNYNYVAGTVPNSDNRAIGSDYGGWIDMFGWGTSCWNSGAKIYKPYSTSNDGLDYLPGNNPENNLTGEYAFADWGIYNQIGKDEPGTWRTLTKDEWNYLLVKRTDAGNKYGAAKVNGVTGIVLLPDEWMLPSGCGFTAGMTGADDHTDWSLVLGTNIYSAVIWQKMEEAGAVFIPVAGYRGGTDVYHVGAYGRYWSSSAYTDNQAYEFNILSNYIGPQDYSVRGRGFSVRLVSRNKDGQKTFTVTFMDGDKVLGTPQIVDYGSAAVAPEVEIPQCVSLSWDNDFSYITGNLTVKAVWTGTTMPAYSVSANDETQGTVIVTQEPTCENRTLAFRADAAEGYEFVRWSDGNTDNPRTLTLAQDTALTAVFEPVIVCGTIETTDGTTVWEDELPFTWEDKTFTEAGTQTATLKSMDGCDSVVTFTLRVRYHNIVLQENKDAQYYDFFAEDYNGYAVNTATLNRQFAQGKWATLCLPFYVRKGQMISLGLYGRVFEFRYAEMTENNTLVAHFAVAQSLEAGKGYIVNANAKLAAKTSFVFPSVTVNTEADNGDITTLTGYN
ncbi:MAG: leucine-rich repeat protein, partial [Paludibacteraceae bacterium]|nr:leucine-rich repeat protein [Paludibacteraceae bacterium]